MEARLDLYIFFSGRRLAGPAGLLCCLLFCLFSRPVPAHDDKPIRPLPPASVTGTERGIALAFNCDHAIHELLGEYAACMRVNHEQVGTDVAAETAFRFMAWLRASTAAWQGYADGPQYKTLYRADFLAAQRNHRIAPALLCRAVGIDCATLPEAVPEQ